MATQDMIDLYDGKNWVRITQAEADDLVLQRIINKSEEKTYHVLTTWADVNGALELMRLRPIDPRD